MKKSTAAKKTTAIVDRDILNIPLPVRQEVVSRIEIFLNERRKMGHDPDKVVKLHALFSALQDCLQPYKDKRVTLKAVHKLIILLLRGVERAEQQQAFLLTLSNSGIVADVILAGDCEEFKTLLAICDRALWELLCFPDTSPEHAPHSPTLSYRLLSFAVCHGSLSMVQMLRREGYQLPGSVLLYSVPLVDPIPMMLGISQNEPELLERYGALLYGMSLEGKKRFFAFLAEHNPSVNQHVASPLYIALFKEYWEFASSLLRVGVDPVQLWIEPTNGQVHWPIELIFKEDLAKYLGLIPEKKLLVLMNKTLASGWTTFQLAISCLSVKCIDHCLKIGLETDLDMKALVLDERVNQQVKTTVTALMVAVSCKKESLVRSLLMKKASPNKMNSLGDTALTLAIKGNQFEIAALLLSYKADANQRPETNVATTPLNLAVITQRHEFIKLLIEYGASPSLGDSLGISPVGRAIADDCFETMKAFVDAGVNCYEHYVDQQSLAQYAFFLNPRLLRYLCEIQPFDLRQKTNEGFCFKDYLGMEKIPWFVSRFGEVQARVFDPEQVLEIISSAVFVASDSDCSDRPAPLSASIALMPQSCDQEAVLAAACQREEALQKYLFAQNAELAKERKQRRQQESLLSAWKKKAERPKRQPKIACDTFPLPSTRSVSQTTGSEKTATAFDQAAPTARPVVLHTRLPLVFAAHPLEKKDQKACEEELRLTKASRSRQKKLPQSVRDTSYLIHVDVNFPSPIEAPATVSSLQLARYGELRRHQQALQGAPCYSLWEGTLSSPLVFRSREPVLENSQPSQFSQNGFPVRAPSQGQRRS